VLLSTRVTPEFERKGLYLDNDFSFLIPCILRDLEHLRAMRFLDSACNVTLVRVDAPIVPLNGPCAQTQRHFLEADLWRS